MRPGSNNDLVYCLRILEAIGKIKLYSNGSKDPFDFFEANDQKDFNASLLQLLHIGEQANRLSEETKQIYEAIPWQQIRAFRNIVAHDYIGVDKLIVFETIQVHLPQLVQQIGQMIRELLVAKVFDPAEYQLSKVSRYYKHIDFDTIV
jgi:uncharacterized protein with HEPN domain